MVAADKSMKEALSKRASAAKLEAALKTPAAADVGAPKAKGRPKKADAPSPVGKKAMKAAPAPELSNKFRDKLHAHLKKELLKKSMLKGTTKGAFTTKGHGMGKRLAKDEGMDDEDVCSAQRAGYGLAVAYWNENI